MDIEGRSIREESPCDDSSFLRSRDTRGRCIRAAAFSATACVNPPVASLLFSPAAPSSPECLEGNNVEERATK